jgi:hypothetical protein
MAANAIDTDPGRPSSFEAARPGPSLPPELIPRGETAEVFEPGDFLLVASKGFGGFLIRVGQFLRFRGEDRKFVKWTHAALIVDTDGTLIEAVGSGVREASVKDYRKPDYLVVRIIASPENRAEIVAFARWALERRAKYNRLATVSIGLSMLTGSKLAFYIEGRFVCSGLVARALERSDRIFDRDPAHIAPGDLVKYYLTGSVRDDSLAACEKAVVAA